MTWDVYALRPPHGVRRLEDLPEGWLPPVVGDPGAVAARVREAAPHAEPGSGGWLALRGPDHDVDVALGKGVEVRDLTLYVNGGDGAVPVVLAVCRAVGVVPFDTETGDVLTEDSRPPGPPADDADDEPRGFWRRLVRR
ncbi:hypothetical protein [Vallicoccus soli]|uniref:Uncharacterized protein n=1 Tax=Vallicoccus soli TaxID=2339232 RepID=A0A3A3YVV1_9ACTN|nr:hypothetical protein [Vallicoccus soli]RJK94889.1 hypothetical protein D5H78_13930 [Vallicoccus soli]